MIAAEPNRRRRATRAFEPGGTAVCRTAERRLRYRVQDASESGIALGMGPRLSLGTPVELRLWWPSVGTASADGVVCRHGSDDIRLAVKYTSSTGVASLIDDLLHIKDLRETRPQTLLCGHGKAIDAAALQLGEAGRPFLRVESALETIRALQDPWLPVTSVVIEPSMRWLELAVFIGDEFPNLNRLMLAPQHSAADEELAVRNGIVDQGLRGPWHQAALLEALAV